LSDSQVLSESLNLEVDEDADILYHISKKDLSTVQEGLRKNKFIYSEKETDNKIEHFVSTIIDKLQEYPNDSEHNLFVKTAIKWIKNTGFYNNDFHNFEIEILSEHTLNFYKSIFDEVRGIEELDIQKFKTPI
jgi:hypothetical protein